MLHYAIDTFYSYVKNMKIWQIINLAISNLGISKDGDICIW